MSGFPFLRMPELVQFDILRTLHVTDLIALSFCSQKLKRLVSFTNVPMSHLSCFFETDPSFFINKSSWDYIRIDEPNNGSGVKKVILANIDYEAGVFRVRTLFTSSEAINVIENLLIRHLIGMFRRIDEIEGELGYGDVLNNPFKNYKSLSSLNVSEGKKLTEEEVKFLLNNPFKNYKSLSILNVSEGKKLTEEEVKFILNNLFKNYKSLSSLNVSEGKKLTEEEVKFILNNLFKNYKSLSSLNVSEGKKLTEEEVKFLLDELTVTKLLKIQRAIEDGFEYSEGLKTETVQIDHAHFLTMDAVLNSTSQRIFLYKCRQEQFTSAQLNNFLKTWISKEKMEKLKKFTISLKLGDRFSGRFSREVIERISHERVSGGIVKVSRVDGTTAEVIMVKTRFYFTVQKNC